MITADAGAGFEMEPAKAAAILDARTAALARRVEQGREERDNVLVIAMREERYALPLSALAGVVAARPLGALAAMSGAIAGTLYERGEIWVAYSLSALLGRRREGERAAALLLLRRDRRRVALAVERVEGLANPLRAGFVKASGAHHSLIDGATPNGLMLIAAEALWRHPALFQGKAS